MQKINSLEQWQDKVKQYNPKANNGWIWAMMIAMLLMVFATPYIYPASTCWENITCDTYTQSTPGSPVTEVCLIDNISIDGSLTGAILIEVIQGGANSDRDYSFIANRDSILVTNNIYFEMSEETTPTYILCHAYDARLSATGGYEAGKIGLLNFWMSTSTSTERDYNMEFPSKVLIAQEESEEQREINDYRSPLAIGVLILVIIAAVFIYSKNAIIGSALFFIIAIGLLIMLPSMYWIGLIGVVISIIIAIATIAGLGNR